MDTERSSDISEIISAIEKSRPAARDFLLGPASPRELPSQAAIDEFLVAQLDPDGRASKEFDKILREQAADVGKLADKLNSEALAASKGRRAHLLTELEDRIAVLPPDPYARHFLDKPFLIWTDAELNGDYAIAPHGSWVKFEVETTTAMNAYSYFYYLWTNDRNQAVTVNIDAYLIAEGYVELSSDGGYLPRDRHADTQLTAVMYPWQWWNQPATIPPPQGGQVQALPPMKVESSGIAAGAGFDAWTVFRGFDLQYQQLAVPAHGSIVIYLEFVVTASAKRGEAKIDFQNQDRAVVSPGVLITVM